MVPYIGRAILLIPPAFCSWNHGFERILLRFHSNVGVPRKHRPGEVTRDVHDGLIARAAFSKLRNQGLPGIVPAPEVPGPLPQISCRISTVMAS